MCKIFLHFYDLLFNACICDLFYDIDDLDFASFADGNTPYSCLSDMISVLDSLKEVSIKYLIGLKNVFLKKMLINVTYLLVQKLLWGSRCQISL